MRGVARGDAASWTVKNEPLSVVGWHLRIPVFSLFRFAVLVPPRSGLIHLVFWGNFCDSVGLGVHSSRPYLLILLEILKFRDA